MMREPCWRARQNVDLTCTIFALSSDSLVQLTFSVEGTNVHTGAVVKAKLNLIDLAGSERISKTDATGDRLRYGKW